MASIVTCKDVFKSFGNVKAVNGISFSIEEGEIFGLIGPNGAGKTTTIRMMMDIIKPDSGEVTIFGGKLGGDTKNKLGYLPEEKGLYKKLKVLESITYLASLKGMDRNSATEKADVLLERAGMLETKNQKIEEMSRGMGQIIQFISTIIHDPMLVVMDEPFSGLDPVNTELLKDMLHDLRNQGKAVILSTHQMSQVEELCDRILMVNKGRAVLYGNLREIKAGYRSNSVLVEYQGEIGEIPGVTEKRAHRGYDELVLDGDTTPKEVMTYLAERDITVSRFEVATPSLHEIFLKEVGKSDE
ncbi:MAG: ATP-binding cassette domain-containing protein [Dehalococcoidia bacterium]|jgi:ABC-2 type transport system ATP-binding protein